MAPVREPLRTRSAQNPTMNTEHDLAPLYELVHPMGKESGLPAGFNVREWLERWMSQEVPALGSRRPIDVLKEPGGFEQVRSILLGMQGGAYF